ncbi:MAG: hypothetical protein WA705_12710 [Candidatus Ozemobacteraceae bacterium]
MIGLFLVLIGMWGFFSFSLSAASFSYNLELRIMTERSDEFYYECGIDDRAVRKITENVHEGIQPYLVEARKAMAERAGYRVEIYGAENYKMVVIKTYSLVIRDVSQSRVIFKKG